MGKLSQFTSSARQFSGEQKRYAPRAVEFAQVPEVLIPAKVRLTEQRTERAGLFFRHGLERAKTDDTGYVIESQIRTRGSRVQPGLDWGCVDRLPCIRLSISTPRAWTHVIIERIIQLIQVLADPSLENGLVPGNSRIPEERRPRSAEACSHSHSQSLGASSSERVFHTSLRIRKSTCSPICRRLDNTCGTRGPHKWKVLIGKEMFISLKVQLTRVERSRSLFRG